MNNQGYAETQLDLKELFFRLLSQWKAVLIAALIGAIAVTGLKLVKDTRAYDLALEAEESVDFSTEDTNEREEEIIEELGEDYLLVATVIQQERLVNQQYNYLNESVKMKIDSANVKNLVFTYFVSGAGAETQKIFTAYKAALRNSDYLSGLKEAIGIDVDEKYVKELVSAAYDPFSENEIVNSGVITYRVRIPESTEPDVVESYVMSEFNIFQDEISNRIAVHTLENMDVEIVSNYDTELFSQKVSIINNINSIQNAIRTNKNNFNAAQKDAYQELRDIAEMENEFFVSETGDTEIDIDEPISGETDELTEPSISKKYMLLGFVFGVFLYAFIYLLVLILKNRVRSASDAEVYTGARVLGEVYNQNNHRGMSRLLHSKVIERALYRGLFDVEKQIGKTVSSIVAICENKDIKNITLLNIGESNEQTSGAMEDIKEKLKSADVDAKIVELGNEIDERSLVDLENAVIVVTADNTSSSQLIRVAGLLKEFGTDCIGTVYNQGI